MMPNISILLYYYFLNYYKIFYTKLFFTYYFTGFILIKIPKTLDPEIILAKNVSVRFKSEYQTNPELKVRFIDPLTGSVWGYLVIDNTLRGRSIGGIRIAPNLTLTEISQLAYTMTLKNSAAGIPFGGGKAGLIADPLLLDKEPQLRVDLISVFAQALFSFDNYICAPDIGTNENDTQQIYELNSRLIGKALHSRGGTGRKQQYGGIPIDEWSLTAHGLIAAITEFASSNNDINIKGANVVIQGYGNVGAATATKLEKNGAKIVGASDINAGLWEPTGLNIKELNSIRNQVGGLNNYTGKIEKFFDSSQLNWLLEAPCDILVPAARANVITSRNADRIQCKIILQGSNAPINKMTEYYLIKKRGIVSLSDFIVNSGGVIGCALEIAMQTDEVLKKVVLAADVRSYTENLIKKIISNNIREVINQINQKNKTGTFFREEAIYLAKKRLQNIDFNYLTNNS
jgi:glutamate dehydrogenase (NAD(P)+)|tara:strand:+ start:5793 stop:7169 length:1377 start_codon:yes stop_codon:yes gene_type:complete